MKKILSLIACMLAISLPTLSLAAEPAPLASGEIMNAAYLVKLAGGLVAVIALFFAMAWIMRNMGVGTVSKDGVERLKITATLSVGTRERIVLIEAGSEQILLGVTQGEINKLHVWRNPSAERFAAELEKSRQEDHGASHQPS
ncbi:MAG TPA: flagellar biosynthetic protein FliO [Gammaproteobacteria bacterium]|nr:flagellar biosynthetic protein FliO [Gammaproteobacteria bacterium]